MDPCSEYGSVSRFLKKQKIMLNHPPMIVKLQKSISQLENMCIYSFQAAIF